VTIYAVCTSRERRLVREEFCAAQIGLCAICQEPMTKPRLDHCHVTGFVRGALCNSCNVKLGWFEKRRKEIENYLAQAAPFAAWTRAEIASESRLPARDTGWTVTSVDEPGLATPNG
jgi:hypothetical protein